YEYENFSKFVEKYYEHVESAGQPLDIISNLDKYRDIDYYEKSLLSQQTTLASSILADATTLTLVDGSSFPEENGYIQIGEEILFYQTRSGNVLQEVSRGVSGNTTLGDLYSSSAFVTTAATPHGQGSVVRNISNLFLYALVKEFEKTYLSEFPEAYLKEDVDKRNLIKNITSFYKAKGTDRSIKFLFNAIVTDDPRNVPEVVNPKDYTLKASVSDWTKNYSLKVKVNSGNAFDLVGKLITQELDPADREIEFASAIVDNVVSIGSDGQEDLYELILEPSTINGVFQVAGRTTTTKLVSSSLTADDRINVKSTMGFPQRGKLLIGDEVIVYKDKTVNQFIIDTRVGPIRNHNSGKTVYRYSTIIGGNVKVTALGIVYNLLPLHSAPYSKANEPVEIGSAGFESINPIIFDKILQRNRWLVNTDPTNKYLQIKGVTSQIASDVGAVFEDDLYYYICSSSYPSDNILTGTNYNVSLLDQKLLKLIRKEAITTTEVYETTSRDVGIFIDGVPALGYKSDEFVKYGPIVSSKIDNKGFSYAVPPYVLVNEQTDKARAFLNGETVGEIEILTDEIFTETPTIRITSGENAVLNPVITAGEITSMDIVNAGRYYSSPPTIRIVDTLGKGNFAEYEAILNSDGSIAEVRKINGGRFYTRGYTTVVVEPVGRSAAASVEIRKWVFNRYERLKNNLDSNNGTVLANFNPIKDYGYAYLANPRDLRARAYANISNFNTNLNLQNQHSPIIGYAYDGNPIYGPYGYSNPVDSTSSIQRLSSGYVLNGSRANGPDTGKYPLGSFIDDYRWVPSVNSGITELDENNGRFCVTPDYPNGTYAYFISVDNSDEPTFPYILGKNFYSLPVDSNYNSNISQDDIPVGLKSLRTDNSERNGSQFSGFIQDVKSGNITSTYVEDSTNNFSPGNTVHIDNNATNGSGAVVSVEQVTGETVVSVESRQTKASQIKIQESAYLFEGDEISQTAEDGTVVATGELIGDVINSNEMVVRNVNGTFNTIDPIDSETLVLRLVLDSDSNFTAGATLRLTNDDNEDQAAGLILETISRQNSVKVRVNTGTFSVTSQYYLRSSNLSDSNRVEIVSVESLSTDLTPFFVDENIAIVTTNTNHNLGKGDKFTIDILPDDNSTETTYYVRKRLYQTAVALAPVHTSEITDEGIGSFDVLNSGFGYTTDIYDDVELIFQDSSKARNNIGLPGDPWNARATIDVSNPAGLGAGGVASIIITTKGKGYKKGDILTVADTSLSRLVSETSSQRLVLEVDHVGFSYNNTILKLTNVTNVSQGDFLRIGPEVVEVEGVDTTTKEVIVSRGKQGTIPTNHYKGAKVTLKDGTYRFDDGFRPFGADIVKPFLISYDSKTQEIFVSYDYNANNPQVLSNSSSFFDSSIPQKLVQFRTVDEEVFKLEFSKDNIEFNINPIIDIQKYYKYTFDTSHFSMLDTYLDFSSSVNYNVFTQEKETSGIAPGNAGSYLSIKLGFGPAIATNTYQERRAINFQNYFYFIKVSPNVDTSGSYLRIIDDPLTGLKEVIYNTETKFVYSLNRLPAYDGTGDISYITSSRLAVGKIHSLKVVNTGEGYTQIPIVSAVSPTIGNEAIVDPVWDFVEGKVTAFNIISKGSGYSKPVAIVTDGDGKRYEYECFVYNGEITQVKVNKEGFGFTYKPTIKIAESDVTIYLESNNIGLPQNVRINNPGRAYNSDKSQLGSYRSSTTFVLRNISDKFYFGEKITQLTTGATAFVAKDGWREGSNLLKVINIDGVFRTGEEIRSVVGNRTANLHAQLYTEFNVDFRSYVDNFGFFSSDRGKLSNANQKLQDSYFYQDYSYVVKSKTSIQEWRDLIKKTTHPAGFQLFGEMVIDSKAEAPMPTVQPSLSYVSKIELPPVQIQSLSTTKVITLLQEKLESIFVEDGYGSISVDTFDTSETQTYNVTLLPDFDGDFDSSTGQLVGTTEFTLINKRTGTPLVLTKNEQLIVSLDGIFQEPGVSYTINSNKITFSQPPLGRRIVEGQVVDSVKFYGRAVKFKNSDLNDRYFRKVKSIADQFDGSQFEFDLYWEDGSIVKSDPSENFIVALNGVVQKARITEEQPFGNSYSIIRSEDPNDTDKIRFSKPPIDNEDAYGPAEELPESLKNYEKCFIYTLGSYERLTINSILYEYRFGGPYLIQDELTGSVRKIDDPKYALVFIDGVLQRESDSYTIVGPNITFTKPLGVSVTPSGERITQDVNIILFYGRDVAKTLTFYDFERDTYFNTVYLNVEGTGVYQSFVTEINNFSPYNYHIKQGSSVLGEILSYRKVSDDEIVLTIQSPINIAPDENTPITFCRVKPNSDTGYYFETTIPGPYAIAHSYKVDAEGLRVLEKNISPWLYGTEGGTVSWNNKNSLTANLVPGDKILIDGESEYRTIIKTPTTAKTKSFVDDYYIQNEMYAKVLATNYEGDTEGEGLSVTATINAFGAITTLNVADLDFNQRDLELYFEKGILLQPTAYEYFTTPEIHFIPIDGNGGGAKAEVIAYGGQILDIVLTDGGSGYTQPPQVVVARRYKRIKDPHRKIDSLTILNIQSGIDSVFSMIGNTEVRIEGGPFSPQAITSFVTFGGFDPELNTARKITQIVETLPGEERQVRMTDEKFVSEFRVQSPTIVIPPVEYNVDEQITTIVGGIVGTESVVTLQTASRELTKIVQIKANKAFYQDRRDSLNGIGTFLDAPMSTTDTIAYVPNTTRFPDTPSRLRIGREIIYYTHKEQDRFLGLTRAYQGSPLEAHQAGDLVLHYPEFVTLLSGGVNSIITEVSAASSTVREIEKTSTIQSISEILDVTTDVEIFGQVQVELNEFDTNVVHQQITIIPPTSYNIVTDVHSTQSRVSRANAGVNEAFGVTASGTVSLTEVSLQLTEENQIQILPKVKVTSVSIGNVASTVSSTSQIVTSNYEQTVLTTNVNVEILNTLSTISTQLVENVGSTIEASSSIIARVTSFTGKVTSIVKSISESEPFVMYHNREIKTTLADIDTFTSTVSMILGGLNGTSSAGTEIDYRYAVVDFIIEEYVLETYLRLRDGTNINLANPYNEVVFRDGSTFLVENRDQNVPSGFEDYELGNVGLTLGSFENNALIDSGISSGLSIQDLDTIYPTLTLRDFEFREKSALIANGDRFNLAIPSYQQPVAISLSGGTVGGPIIVASTEYFADEGYLFTSSGNVIQYTSKT
ncbi:MAG: YHYH protein, partial [Candidatus Nanopelagicaceae bacterium]